MLRPPGVIGPRPDFYICLDFGGPANDLEDRVKIRYFAYTFTSPPKNARCLDRWGVVRNARCQHEDDPHLPQGGSTEGEVKKSITTLCPTATFRRTTETRQCQRPGSPNWQQIVRVFSRVRVCMRVRVRAGVCVRVCMSVPVSYSMSSPQNLSRFNLDAKGTYPKT